MRSAAPTGLIDELAIVSLRQAIECNDGVVPTGTRGTVVHAYRDGAGYEVEFVEPFHCVLTVGRGDIDPA